MSFKKMPLCPVYKRRFCVYYWSSVLHLEGSGQDAISRFCRLYGTKARSGVRWRNWRWISNLHYHLELSWLICELRS